MAATALLVSFKGVGFEPVTTFQPVDVVGQEVARSFLPSLRSVRHGSKPIPERPTVPKRNLRVVKWLGQLPAVGVCTLCNRQFEVPLTTMKRVADAQQSLRLQFTEHECKSEMAPDTAPSGNLMNPSNT